MVKDHKNLLSHWYMRLILILSRRERVRLWPMVAMAQSGMRTITSMVLLSFFEKLLAP